MAFNVSTFRQKIAYDGARPNLFQVTMSAQNGNFGSDSISFFCRAAAIPGTTLGVVNVPYFGREIKLAGNRTFADWTITVINDEDFSYRSFFEAWMEKINTHVGNSRDTGMTGVNQYVNTSGVKVQQMSKSGATTALRTYTLHNAFPNDISDITLDWGDNDSIEEFTVTFAYDYWSATSVSKPNDVTAATGVPVATATNLSDNINGAG
jgi:hypothetical protein